MDTKEISIYTALGIALISIIFIAINRSIKGNDGNVKGIGIRIIQFSSVTILFPFLFVLCVLDILPVSTVAVVAGAIIGYAFAVRDKND
ncbi:hypothetical protein [uncultured Aquimarina sp.]|uniref:hypothetical protein n=1 Tax=uncultured Aquimarina sp. TaxID=575652 RepID=UPI0026324875|nr:hypothetical protein [uncultured Aquimarina sp.]